MAVPVGLPQHRPLPSETSTLNDNIPAMSSHNSFRDIEKDAGDVQPARTLPGHGDVDKTGQELSSDSSVNQSDDTQDTPPTPSPTDPSSFPDGGREAWTTVGGGFCALFVSFGWINCIGIFQTYYQTHQLKAYSPSTVAWVTSLETFFMFGGGIWVGRLYDNYGHRYILIVGTFLHVFGLMMASLSNEYWQFILSQSVCSSIGASMLFYPSVNCISTWFFKKRALAIGIAASGSSLGGVIFPIMVDRLVPEVGFRWTLRICAFLILVIMIIGNLTTTARIKPIPRPIKVMDFLTPFTELKFATMALGMFLFFLGIFTPFTFLILVAESRGVPPALAQYLLCILNAASIFGRILPAWAGDKFGRFSMFVAMGLLSAVLSLALWLPGYGTGATIVFALIFGFSSGCIVSLPPSLVAQLSDIRAIGVRTGAMFFVVAIATLIGTPIGGQLIIADNGGFKKVQIFSGVVMMAGTACFLALRVEIGGWKINKIV